MDRDRAVLVAGHVAVLLAGMALGVWETFLVPLRWPGGVEGLCIVLALGGNLLAGLLSGPGLGTGLGAALPGIGWLVTVLALAGAWPRPEGDVLIPSGVPADPALGRVGVVFLVAGAIGAVGGVLLGSRRILAARLAVSDPGFTTAGERPTSQA